MSSTSAWIIAGVAAAMLVSSCSRTHGPPAPSRQTDQPVLTGEPAGDNAADTAFAEALIALDQQAVDLASLARTHSSDTGIQDFAADSVSARKSEMQIANVLLVQWNTDPEGQRGERPAKTVPGMVDRSTIAELQSVRGGGFDAPWVQAMISLENGALAAATTEVANGKNVDAIDMARQICARRPAEIDQLKKLP